MRTNDNDCEYKRLWANVLSRAIHDLTKKEHKASAKIWFNSEATEFNSFIGVCGILGFDPDKIRASVFGRKIKVR